MNNSKMWLTVNPNLGVPLLLGSVAVASLVVHGAVLTTTPWIANYYQGSEPWPVAAAPAEEAAAPVEAAAPAAEAAAPA
ncbi:light-harvesting protein, partial [Cereibacter johrii]